MPIFFSLLLLRYCPLLSLLQPDSVQSLPAGRWYSANEYLRSLKLFQGQSSGLQGHYKWSEGHLKVLPGVFSANRWLFPSERVPAWLFPHWPRPQLGVCSTTPLRAFVSVQLRWKQGSFFLFVWDSGKKHQHKTIKCVKYEKGCVRNLNTANISALAAVNNGMNLYSSITLAHPSSQADPDTPELHPEEQVIWCQCFLACRHFSSQLTSQSWFPGAAARWSCDLVILASLDTPLRRGEERMNRLSSLPCRRIHQGQRSCPGCQKLSVWQMYMTPISLWSLPQPAAQRRPLVPASACFLFHPQGSFYWAPWYFSTTPITRRHFSEHKKCP